MQVRPFVAFKDLLQHCELARICFQMAAKTPDQASTPWGSLLLGHRLLHLVVMIIANRRDILARSTVQPKQKFWRAQRRRPTDESAEMSAGAYGFFSRDPSAAPGSPSNASS